MCEVVCRVLHVKAAAVSVAAERDATVLCAAGNLALVLDDVQFTTGEGPSVDAFRADGVVRAARISHAADRWPAFAAAAVEQGAGAVFAFPLRVGAARVGVLTLYQAEAGALTPDQEADAPIVADVVTWRIIAMQAGSSQDGLDGLLADGVDGVGHRAEVHQASGMVSAQLGVGIVDALIRLRAHAYSVGRTVADVASDVVGGTLRFEDL
jgi:hypothetical protein